MISTTKAIGAYGDWATPVFRFSATSYAAYKQMYDECRRGGGAETHCKVCNTGQTTLELEPSFYFHFLQTLLGQEKDQKRLRKGLRAAFLTKDHKKITSSLANDVTMYLRQTAQQFQRGERDREVGLPRLQLLWYQIYYLLEQAVSRVWNGKAS